VRSIRIGDIVESKRSQFSSKVDDTTAKRGIKSKRSTELFTNSIYEAKQMEKEKLVLPTINTSRKFQMFEPISLTNLNLNDLNNDKTS